MKTKQEIKVAFKIIKEPWAIMREKLAGGREE